MAIWSYKTLATVLTLLGLAASAPAGPSTFKATRDITLMTGGTHGSQGDRSITLSSSPTSSKPSKNSILTSRNGAGSVVTGAGLNWYASSFSSGGSGYSDPQNYICYNGPASQFPEFSTWMNFYDMFELNQADSMVLEESGPLQGALWNAILQVSADSKVDARFILAVVMQESTGNVQVACTNNGVENCGLMQAYAGSVSFDSDNAQASITQMVIDGTQGTSQGPGLVQWFNDQDYVNGNTGGNPYNVARGYNSGSIDFSNLSDGLGSTAAYVSDVANRLQGWSGNDGKGQRSVCGF